MKVASITVAYNDYQKFEDWKTYYQDYKQEIALHIIVDNCSDKAYIDMIEDFFKDSVILHRTINGGVTAAYNDGIKYALQQNDIDAIMLIDADIKLSSGSVKKLHNVLFSDASLGFVAPVLLKKDSNIVENYGCNVTYGLKFVQLFRGTGLDELKINKQYVDGVPGGMNMAKRRLYETIGLEDEKLFMYADEIDIAIRTKKAGFKMIATKDAVAWHQHKNVLNRSKRLPYVNFLTTRNAVYLAKKHFGFGRAVCVFIPRFFVGLFWLLSKVCKLQFNEMVYPKYSLLGLFYGLAGNMKPNKYSKPNGAN